MHRTPVRRKRRRQHLQKVGSSSMNRTVGVRPLTLRRCVLTVLGCVHLAGSLVSENIKHLSSVERSGSWPRGGIELGLERAIMSFPLTLAIATIGHAR